MELILFLGRNEKIHFSLFKGWRRSSRIFRFNKMADVDVDDFLGARRRSAAIRPREAAIGRRLVLDRGRGPGRAESQISSFSFPFLHSDLLKFTVFREKQLKATMLMSIVSAIQILCNERGGETCLRRQRDSVRCATFLVRRLLRCFLKEENREQRNRERSIHVIHLFP